MFFYQPLFADVAGCRFGAFLVSRNDSAHFPLLLQLLFYFMLVEQVPCCCMYRQLSGEDLLALASKLNMAVVSTFSKDVVLRLLMTE